jgi:hypothetical protein
VVGLEGGCFGSPQLDQVAEGLLKLARLVQRDGRSAARLLTEGAGR